MEALKQGIPQKSFIQPEEMKISVKDSKSDKKDPINSDDLR